MFVHKVHAVKKHISDYVVTMWVERLNHHAVGFEQVSRITLFISIKVHAAAAE